MKKPLFKNFRDLAQFNPHFKSNQIFRSALLTFYQHEESFQKKLASKNIDTIIDFRADRELDKNPYQKPTFDYIHAPFDPWNQSETFQKEYNKGSNAEIAYHFFMLECKESIKKTIETILACQNGLLLHCHAGKDRTGIVVALLALLINTPKNLILKDYLASEEDTSPEKLDIVFQHVEKEGSIVAYLQSCDLSEEQIQMLRKKL